MFLQVFAKDLFPGCCPGDTLRAGGIDLKAKFREQKFTVDKIVTWLAASLRCKMDTAIYLWQFWIGYTVNPLGQRCLYYPYLHECTTATLVAVLLLWQSLQVVFIESTVVKDNVSGAGFCYGSCGDSVIILAPLIPIHFSCVITSSVCLSALSQASVLCPDKHEACCGRVFFSHLFSWGEMEDNDWCWWGENINGPMHISKCNAEMFLSCSFCVASSTSWFATWLLYLSGMHF